MKIFLRALLLILTPFGAYSQNNALNFDGINTGVFVPSHPSMDFRYKMTMEVWVKLSNPFVNQKILGKSNAANGFVMGVAEQDIYPEIWTGSDIWKMRGAYHVFRQGCIPSNQWTHLAVTFESGKFIIAYINGIEVHRKQVNEDPIFDSEKDFSIGIEPFGPPIVFRTTGSIDEVALWNVARTASQIQTDMLGSIPPSKSLVAYYNFDQGVANGNNEGITTLHDVSGNQRHGTLMSFALHGNASNFVTGFTLQDASRSPSITSIVPPSGEVGTPVTIYGTGFSTITDLNRLKFNGVNALISSSTPTSLNTIVPMGSTSGEVTLQADCKLLIANAPFEVIIVPPLWQSWWAYTLYALAFLGLLVLGRNTVISRERKKFLLELERKRIEGLRESERLKTKFFSNITHEFRTPLTLIQGPADEILEKVKDDDLRNLAGMIKSNSTRLLKLINQLLDLARLDAHEMKLIPKKIQLHSFLKGVVSQFTPLAAARRINFEWHIPENLPTVFTDDEKLETIITNPISNAIKFTPPDGKVTVRILLENGERLKIEVTDTGRGIPEQKLKHIFDRFYQVEPTDSSHAEGTGIGLALVKEYVELMKGKIEVESQPGIGTRFSIILPVTISGFQHEASPVKFAREPENKYVDGIDIVPGFDNPLILLTEDSEDIRKFIMTCLGSHFRFKEAAHGREGLELALQFVPDLIISDLMMPEMDGIEFCSRVKNDKRTDHIPFIMLTAKATEESKLEGLETGADDYLVKPFNKTELLFKIQNLITLRKNLQAHIKLTLLTQSTPIQVTSAGEQFVLKARLFVEAHMKDERLSVELLAAEMNLGREQCYRKIISLTGLSPSLFIRKIKLQKASYLLEAKWGPVSQVAYEVGFDNLSHFSKVFKEEFGALPSEYEMNAK